MKIYYNYNDEVVTLDIVVDDESYRYRVIKGDNSLTLTFALSYALKLPLGAWCVFEGERYELKKPKNFTMNNTESYEYTLEMFSDDWNMRRYTVRNMVDKRLKFTITCKPQEHLQLLADNMNAREGAGKWRVGNCIVGVEKPLSLSFTKCSDYLNMIAEAYETEFESTPYTMSDGSIGHDINLGKVEYNKSNPLSLSYGKGNGLRSGVNRINVDDGQAIGVLCVQGGSTNIDSSKYTRWNGSGYEASSELHMPAEKTLRYDGSCFEGEEGFDSTIAHIYTVDDYGLTISCDAEAGSTYEESLNGGAYYPQREEVITSVEIVDSSGEVIVPTADMVSGQDYWVDIIASAIPASLNYSECTAGGETATVILQNGMLSGKEISIETSESGTMTGYVHSERRFRLVSQEIDGLMMPNATAYSGGYMPKVGDTFKVFHISLPTAYYGDNTTKTGAEWDLFREAVKYLSERLYSRYNYTVEVDGLWSKSDWVNIGGKVCLGGYVKFTHDEYEPNGVRIRIIGVKDYINNPHTPVVELSNAPVGAGNGIVSELNKISSNEVKNETDVSNLRQYTKRRYSDAKQTASMLIDAKLNGFTDSISPLTVRTMQAIIGDESLQFYFVSNAESTSMVVHYEWFDPSTKQFKCDAGVMQHKTLGITSLSISHAASEYKSWEVEQYTSAVLAESSKSYYLYIKASKTAETAVFLLSETAIAIESTDGYYHFLTGILNSELNGARSYAPMYGFTLIEPGRMVIDKIQSSNFDIVEFKGMLIDLIQSRIILGDDAEIICKQLSLRAPDGSIRDAYTDITSAATDAAEANTAITAINSDDIFSIDEKLAARTTWEAISGRADVDHTPGEAGSSGSYKAAIALAEEAQVSTTALTEAYQALLDLFGGSNIAIAYGDDNTIITYGDDNATVYYGDGGLLLYEDENIYFDRANYIAKLSAYSNAETGVRYGVINAKAVGGEAYLAEMGSLDDDGKVSVSEKVAYKSKWETIVAEHGGYLSAADAYPAATTEQRGACKDAYGSLNTYLNGSNGLLIDMTTAASVAPNTVDTYFVTYYSKRSLLKEATDAAIDATAQGYATGAAAGVKTNIEEALADGLQESDRATFKESKKTLETSQASLIKSYNGVYNSTYLSGNAKSDLFTAYDDEVTKYGNMLTALDAVISANPMITSLIDTYHTKFGLYSTSLDTYAGKLANANAYIQTALDAAAKGYTDGVVDNLSFSSTNLIDGSESITLTSSLYLSVGRYYFENGATYTWKVFGDCDGGVDADTAIADNWPRLYVWGRDWTTARYSSEKALIKDATGTFTWGGDSGFFYVDFYNHTHASQLVGYVVRNLMLVKGNKIDPTWSASTNDVAKAPFDTLFGGSMTRDTFETIKSQWEAGGSAPMYIDTTANITLFNNAYIKSLKSDNIDVDELTVKNISATNTAGTVTASINGSTGKLTATGATISGNITATSGTFSGTLSSPTGSIGGFTISSNSIKGSSWTNPGELGYVTLAGKVNKVFLMQHSKIISEVYGGVIVAKAVFSTASYYLYLPDNTLIDGVEFSMIITSGVTVIMKVIAGLYDADEGSGYICLAGGSMVKNVTMDSPRILTVTYYDGVWYTNSGFS